MMKKLINLLTGRVVITTVLIIIQVVFMVAVVYRLSITVVRLNQILYILSFLMIIYLVNKEGNPSFKLAWSTLILLFPLFGGLFYILFGNKKVPKELMRSMLASVQKTTSLLKQDDEILKEIQEDDLNVYKQFNYVWKNSYFPVYKNTEATYFSTGEEKFPAMIEELKKAKHFIFLEYFIIREGVFWGSILEVLKEKVKEGIQVYVLYDDAGCIGTLPSNYWKTLEGFGIKCRVFNPLHPKLAIQMNNRDHRKITVIDNNVAFVGGINLGDEYINETVRFGHWKDTAMMLRGEAVWSFTVMFIQFWQYVNKEENFNYKDYQLPCDKVETEGYMQPLSDSPTDDEEVGLNVHMNIINNAKKFVYIQTPYLVIGFEMQKALVLAARSGVDVRIVVPHVPDKWYVHQVTQSNYRVLIEAGVKIYEYLPGFIHSKIVISDDLIGILGTINMDYRSYYMHYECGTLIYKDKILDAMKGDYLQTLDSCQQITLEDCKKTFILIRMVRAILNLFAPIM